MFTKIMNFFRPPVFEGDEEKTRSAQLLYQIVVASWSLPAIAVIVNFLSPSLGRFVLLAAIVLAATLVVIMALNRAGKVSLASNVIVGLVFIVFTYLNYVGGGEPRPFLLLTVVTIMMSGLLLGTRGPIVVAILLAVQHVIIIWLSARGLIVPQTSPTTPLQNVFVTVVGYLLTGFMLRLAISRIQIAVDKMKENEAKLQASNRELQELSTSLEQRVAERTRDLEIVAEVSTATATILRTDQLLQEAVDLTKERFKLYHSHIYLLDPAGENLVLAAGAGEPGRQMVAVGHSIAVNREHSLVARAARERKGVIVNDVTQAPDFLPNPRLPNTRSELAVPMVVGSSLIGVFDVQSDQLGRFADSDINVQTTLAAQVAASVQNVRSFEQSKAQADLESLVNTIGQKIQRAASVEDTLQTAIREIGLALGASRVSAAIQASHLDRTERESLSEVEHA
jgi:putative methionine-R-sulfoxide reductase with GAF domain